MTFERFSTPISRKLYSYDNIHPGNDSTVNIEEFSTPLQKLSNNSLNDIILPHSRELRDIGDGVNRIDEFSKIQESPSLANDTVSIMDSGHNVNGSLQPLSDVAFQLYQTKLSIDTHKEHPHHNKTFNQQLSVGSGKPPIYYRPPSSQRTQYGIKKFLPPNFESGSVRDNATNKVPITVAYSQNNNIKPVGLKDEDEDEVDDQETSENPTGEWFNPIVREALKRQVRKEVEVKKIGINLIYLFTFKLAVAIGNYVLSLYEYKRMPFHNASYYPPVRQDHLEPGSASFYVMVSIRIIYGLFIFNCIMPCYRLCKTQDQCLDLPLNNHQRKLLGLNIDHGMEINSSELEDKEDKAADLVMKKRRFQSGNISNYSLPKYNKSNVYSAHQTKPTLKIDEKLLDPTDLTVTDKFIKNKLIHTGSHKSKSRDTNLNLHSNFSKNFNIEFNCSDGEDDFSTPVSLANKSFDFKGYDHNVFRR